MEILHFEDLGIRVLFGCKRSCSSPRRVSNFNSKVPQGYIYPHIKFERDRVFTSSGSMGGRGGRGHGGRGRGGSRRGHGGDAETIISPNTSFGDIITK